MEYNTTRNHLHMREYGRHIQKMIEYVLTIEDEEVRQRNAQTVIEMMGFFNPQLKNVDDFKHKLWDHLFLISEFKLDIKSPFPIPTKETLFAKPAPLPYPHRKPKYNHLGKNLELLINKALLEEDTEKQNVFANVIAYYMKLAYSNWHKEMVHDDVIQAELSSLTDGKLTFTNTPFVKAYRHQPEGSGRSGYSKHRNSGGRHHNKNGRNNNQRSNKRRY